MRDETQLLIKKLVDSIHRSNEYIQYQSLLQSIKKYPELYQRIGEFRRRSILFDMMDHENLIEDNNALQKEFSDLQSNGLASEFMAAEHQYCQMLKLIQQKYTEQLDLEIDFLEE